MTCLTTPYIGKWASFEISSTIRKKPFLLQLEASFGRQTRWSKRGSFLFFFKDWESRAVDAQSLANVRLEQAGNTLHYRGGKICSTVADSDWSLVECDSSVECIFYIFMFPLLFHTFLTWSISFLPTLTAGLMMYINTALKSCILADVLFCIRQIVMSKVEHSCSEHFLPQWTKLWISSLTTTIWKVWDT